MATGEDVADAVLHAALTFDELMTTGQIPPGRAEKSMLLLLMVRDYLMALPPDPGPELAADFSELVATRRADRETARERE